MKRFRIDAHDVPVHIAFWMLCLMAWIYAHERLYADASYYLLHVINSNWFHIEHQRYVLALSQVLPVMASWLRLPLAAILVLYSLGHVLFFYLLFLICRYRYQHMGAGVLLIFIQVLGLAMGYFTPMFESYYGAGLLTLAAVILWSGDRKPIDLILVTVAFFGAVSSHPMVAILACFTVASCVIACGMKYWREYAGFAALLLLFLVWKWLTASGYESYAVGYILETYRTMPYGGGYIWQALQFLLQYYLILLLVLVLSLVILIRQKHLLQAAWVIAGFAGMLVVIHGAHYGFQHSRYQEQVYFPLVWIAAFPLAQCLHRGLDRFSGQLMLMTFIVVFGVRCLGIIREAPMFQRRVARMERMVRFMETQGVVKGFVGEANVNVPTSVDANWSWPIETLLLSALAGRDHAVSICYAEDMAFDDNASRLDDQHYLMRKWDIMPHDWLNRHYFNLRSAPYQKLDAGTLPDSLGDDPSTVSILPSSSALRMDKDRLSPLMVTVTHGFLTAIPADTSEKVYLCYHWQKQGETLTWDGQRTPFEVSVPQSGYQQTMDIMAPEAPGTYTLLLDIVADGRQWFGLDVPCEVLVR